jgi:hypothetical protein
MAGASASRGWKIEVTNLKQVLNAIEGIDKSAVKSIEKTIRGVAKGIAGDAASLTPSNNPIGNWGQWTFKRDGRDLSFNSSDVAKGFKVKKNNFKRRGVNAGFGFDVIQYDAAGAIFEVMGDGSRVTTRGGANMVNMINQRFPRKQPRTLIAAYYQNMNEEVRDSIREQIISEARKAGLT